MGLTEAYFAGDLEVVGRLPVVFRAGMDMNLGEALHDLAKRS